MNKYYTIGEVIDTMQFGEVAVKVEVDKERENTIVHSNNKFDYVVAPVGTAIFFDEKENGMLKFVSPNKSVHYFKDDGDDVERYVIMSREAYNAIKK